MGIHQPDNIYFEEGKKVHRIIQDHVARIKTDNSLKHILVKFPVVERVDFDPKCRFEFKFSDKYLMTGFYDGIDWENKRFLEIKSSSTLWSMGKFKNSIQRKIYALSNPVFKEAYLITCSRNPDDWKSQPPKTFKLPCTEEDREEARHWIKDGTRILEQGEFTKDLVDGKCVDPRCWWGDNCQFK